MTIKTQLEDAFSNHESDAVEKAMCHEIRPDDDCTEILCKLLECDWHLSHEDITLALQRLGDPKAIKVLRRVAERKFDYLEYNNSEALARKCTWALADIGTPEAKAALEEIVKLPDEVIASYATERLESWQNELHRKKA